MVQSSDSTRHERARTRVLTSTADRPTRHASPRVFTYLSHFPHKLFVPVCLRARVFRWWVCFLSAEVAIESRALRFRVVVRCRLLRCLYSVMSRSRKLANFFLSGGSGKGVHHPARPAD